MTLKNIKRYSAFLLALTLSLSGCAKDKEQQNEDAPSVTTAASDSEDKSDSKAEEKEAEKAKLEEEERQKAEKEEAEKKKFSLLDLTVKDLDDIYINAEHSVNDKLYNNSYGVSTTLDNAKILSDIAFTVNGNGGSYLHNVRKTTGTLVLGDKTEDNPLNTVLNNIEWGFTADFDGLCFYDPLVVIDNLPKADFNSGTISTDHIIYSYNIDWQDVTGFIKKTDYGYYEFIPDPAYSLHLPSMHKTGKECYHIINGTGAYIDSPVIYINDQAGQIPEEVGSDYIYAKMKLNANCYYDTTEGYISSITYNRYACQGENGDSVSNFEIITEDVYSKMASDFTVEEADDYTSAKVYSLIMSNMDTLCTDTTMGITLLDLDFDGTPEIISASYTPNGEYEWENDLEAKIYSIKDGSLKYIDSLSTGFSDRTMFLSCGTDHNGEKAWIFMSDKDVETGEDADVDYTFTLENGKLNYTEIFRTEETDPDADYFEDRYTHYYLGKEVTFKQAENSEYDDYVSINEYDLAQIEGHKYDIYGMIQSDYFNRFDKIYTLYTDTFVSSNGNYSEHGLFTYLNPDSRAVSYGMAYLVDAYYKGEYVYEKGGYDYHFYGDYEKPVIYLYPEEETDVSVKVKINGGRLTCTYPDYGSGWNVTAYPDGTLINKADGREYQYLYWEGRGFARWDTSQGFVVKGSDTAEFLQEKLEFMGLTSEEYNEFIVYWLPLMYNNKYNLITFQQEAYTELAQLKITPSPDSMLRVFMTFMPLDEEIEIPEQKLESFERTGFTVVEWGGTKIIPHN